MSDFAKRNGIKKSGLWKLKKGMLTTYRDWKYVTSYCNINLRQNEEYFKCYGRWLETMKRSIK